MLDEYHADTRLNVNSLLDEGVLMADMMMKFVKDMKVVRGHWRREREGDMRIVKMRLWDSGERCREWWVVFCG